MLFEEAAEGGSLKPLPPTVVILLDELDAPARLITHLRLVYDTALALLQVLKRHWPKMPLDRDAVLFGAATHDVGKVLFPEELSAPGKRHEAAGEALLLARGVSPERARFCRTHAQWTDESPLEDLLVALADNVWKGKRHPELEDAVTTRIAGLAGEERWSVFMVLDEALTDLAQDADLRLAYSVPGE